MLSQKALDQNVLGSSKGKTVRIDLPSGVQTVGVEQLCHLQREHSTTMASENTENTGIVRTEEWSIQK